MNCIYRFNIEKLFNKYIKNNSNLILLNSEFDKLKITFAFHLALETLKYNNKFIINSQKMNVIDIQHKLCAIKDNISLEKIDEEFQLNKKYSIDQKMKMSLHYRKKGIVAFLSNENYGNIILNDIKNFIFKNPETNLIILDSLESYFYEDKNNFLTKLKLISSTYNLSVLILSNFNYDVNENISLIYADYKFIDLYLFLYTLGKKVDVKLYNYKSSLKKGN